MPTINCNYLQIDKIDATGSSTSANYVSTGINSVTKSFVKWKECSENNNSKAPILKLMNTI